MPGSRRRSQRWLVDQQTATRGSIEAKHKMHGNRNNVLFRTPSSSTRTLKSSDRGEKLMMICNGHKAMQKFHRMKMCV